MAFIGLSQNISAMEEDTLGGIIDLDFEWWMHLIHTQIHFQALVQGYALLWNLNVSPGERKHKFFKNAVLSTNHQKVEIISNCFSNSFLI